MSAKFNPADLVDIYFTGREEWIEALVIESSIEDHRFSYAVELNNGEVLESISQNKLRLRSKTSRYLPFDSTGTFSTDSKTQHCVDEHRFSLRLVSRWSLNSPPLPQKNFDLPSLEPLYHHPTDTDNDACIDDKSGDKCNDHWPSPLQLVDPTQLHEGAEKSARKMVTAPLLPPGEGFNGSKKSRQSKFTFVRAENVVNPILLKQWRWRLKSTRLECSAATKASGNGTDPVNRIQHSSPVLAWHSTPWHGNLDKIIETGLLTEGDRQGCSNKFLQTAHGQR